MIFWFLSHNPHTPHIPHVCLVPKVTKFYKNLNLLNFLFAHFSSSRHPLPVQLYFSKRQIWLCVCVCRTHTLHQATVLHDTSTVFFIWIPNAISLVVLYFKLIYDNFPLFLSLALSPPVFRSAAVAATACLEHSQRSCSWRSVCPFRYFFFVYRRPVPDYYELHSLYPPCLASSSSRPATDVFVRRRTMNAHLHLIFYLCSIWILITFGSRQHVPDFGNNFFLFFSSHSLSLSLHGARSAKENVDTMRHKTKRTKFGFVVSSEPTECRTNYSKCLKLFIPMPFHRWMDVHQTTKPHRMEYRGKSCRYMMSSPSSLNTHFHSLTPRSLTESGCNKNGEKSVSKLSQQIHIIAIIIFVSSSSNGINGSQENIHKNRYSRP